MRKVRIEHDRLIELLDYDEIKGLFMRKVRTGSNCKMDRPLGNVDTRGYLQAKVDCSNYLLHRLAWFYVTKEWPPNDIDHIDGNRINNSFSNLRLATRSENSCNRGKSSNNTTGFKGVTFHKATGKYAAQILIMRNRKWLGLFETAELAHEAYCIAAKSMHNEFANTKGHSI